MKIFGVGLSKTGTTSLNKALTILGYKSGHYIAYFSAVDKLDAVTDLPMALEYKELNRRYPNSKFILTIRNIEDWLKSCEKHFKPTDSLFLNEVRLRAYGCKKYDRALFTESYFCHNADVIRSIPKERLLIFNVNEGWAPLCKFLDKPIPECNFPHENKRT